jgi:hypothetical protein
MIEDYLMWRRDKELYPPRYSAEEWVNELIMSEANVRINLIKDLLERNDLDPVELATAIHELVYDDIGDLYDDAGMVSDGASQPLYQED